MIGFAPEKIKLSRRREWLVNRKKLEAIRFNKLSEKAKRTGRTHWLDHVLPYAASFLKVAQMYKRGVQNALDIQVQQVELKYKELPAAFDGYKILHLSDLHIDSLPGIEEVICNRISSLEYDLCALTGDYRLHTIGNYDAALGPLQKIINCISAKDGMLATLGNHDTHEVVHYLEEMGVKVLTNETFRIEKENESIAFTGTDDPCYYYSNQIKQALAEPVGGFKVALIHTPELFHEAAENGYHLYLCGHTHGGQICLPTGKPIITHLEKGKDFYKGLWQYGNLKGYTSMGCGVSGLPIRFFNRGEITVFTLRKE